ncbi:MAG TPA: hypothetical protein P5119_12350 [Candidatus Aminicenantes bacterium]|nr:hypothetical protein [Candidatus Aminicenantes bacterium]HRY66115.1 hypothetical protein [Candidatus Aminicenantes bacterium]HRZ73029.1 hypothetical protein [Candidatus Aminicenantes bacterium]
MKRWLSILAMLAVAASAAYGMEIRFHLQAFGGVSSSLYAGSSPGGWGIPEVSAAMNRRAGLAAGFGAGMTLPLADVVYYVASFEYLQKGAGVDYYYWDDPISRDIYQLDEIGHSSFIKLKPLRRLSPYGLIGYSFSYVLSHKLKTHSGSAEPVDLTSDTARHDNGPVLGWGVEFEGRRWGFFVEHRHYFGGANLSKMTGSLADYPSLRARSDIVIAGIRYTLGGRR